jgi:hypothetical protein
MAFDTNSAYLHGYGTTVGGLPGGGGYAPNQTEAVMNAMRAQQDSRMTAWLLQNDTRAQHAAHMVGGMVAGSRNADAWVRDNGRATAMVAGMAMNSGMLAPLMGGSVLEMYGGVNTGFAASGRLEMNMGGKPSYYSGSGYVNDQMSRIATSRMQEHFFTNTGGARQHRTHGLDRSELGSIAGIIGMGGGFSNMSGSMRDVNSESDRKRMMESARKSGDMQMVNDLKDLKGADFTKGSHAVFEMDKETSRQVNEKIQAGAKAMAAMKDIFGGGAMTDLVRHAKALTGMDISSVMGSNEIQAKVGRMKVMAAVSGMTMAGVTHEQMAINREVGNGVSSNYGSAVAERVFYDTNSAMDASKKFADTQASSGMYVATASRAEVLALNVHGAKVLSRENPEVAGALYALSKTSGMSGEHQAKIRQALAGVRNVGGATGTERRANLTAARNRLNEAVRAATGASATGIISEIGYDNVIENLGPDASKDLAAFTTSEDQARLKLNAREVMAKLSGGSSASGNFMADVFTTLSTAHQTALTAAIQKGDIAGAKAVINGSDLSSEGKTKLLADLDKGAGEGLDKLKGAAGKLPMLAESSILANNARTEDTTINRKSRLTTWANQRAFGSDLKVDSDLFSNLAKGLFPGTAIGMDRVMGGLIATGQAVNLGEENRNGGRSISDAAAGKLLDAAGGTLLEKAYGLEGMSREQKLKVVRDKMSSAEGYMSFLEVAETGGHGVKRGKDGNTYFGSATALDEMNPKITAQQRVKLYKDLYGGTFKGTVAADADGNITRQHDGLSPAAMWDAIADDPWGGSPFKNKTDISELIGEDIKEVAYGVGAADKRLAGGGAGERLRKLYAADSEKVLQSFSNEIAHLEGKENKGKKDDRRIADLKYTRDLLTKDTEGADPQQQMIDLLSKIAENTTD